MSTPFYVSPEQLMKDRADFARKGIARGRSVVAIQYADGILFVSENPSQALHKVSEIYDRIAFAAVGRYNEFENLRIAGVRLADMRGYAYDRRDVTGRGLANAYAQTLGTIFSSGRREALRGRALRRRGRRRPVRRPALPPHLRRPGRRRARLRRDGWRRRRRGRPPQGALHRGRLPRRRAARRGGRARPQRRGDRVIPTDDLEVAILDRTRAQPRKFVRLRESRLVELLGDRGPEQPAAAVADDSVRRPRPRAGVGRPGRPDRPGQRGDSAARAPGDGRADDAPGGSARGAADRSAGLAAGPGADRPGRTRGAAATRTPAARSRADDPGPGHPPTPGAPPPWSRAASGSPTEIGLATGHVCPARLGWGHGPADLRDRERVRRHVHVQGPAPTEPRRGRALPLPQGRQLGPVVQRLPPQRRPALPRRRQPPGVRHPRVRRHRRAGHPRQGGGADPRGPARSTPSSACTTRASPATSTSSRTTPTRPATPTAATRTTSSAGPGSSASSPTS